MGIAPYVAKLHGSYRPMFTVAIDLFLYGLVNETIVNYSHDSCHGNYVIGEFN